METTIHLLVPTAMKKTKTALPANNKNDDSITDTTATSEWVALENQTKKFVVFS